MGPMLRWVVFTLLFGLLPFAFSVLLQLLQGNGVAWWRSTPELLFFSVMVCAVEMGELFGSLSEPNPAPERPGWLAVAFCCFLLAAVLSSGVYGLHVYQQRDGEWLADAAACGPFLGGAGPARSGAAADCTQWVVFQGNLFTLSVFFAAVLATGALLTEWFRMRRDKCRNGVPRSSPSPGSSWG